MLSVHIGILANFCRGIWHTKMTYTAEMGHGYSNFQSSIQTPCQNEPITHDA